MNKAELASRAAVDATLSGATTCTTIAGFDAFATRHRAGQRGCSPATGEAIAIAASTAGSFKPGKAIRDAVDPRNR